MIVLMRQEATPEDLEKIRDKIVSLGGIPHVFSNARRSTVAITGIRERVDTETFMSMAGVEDVVRVSKPYKLVSREFRADDTTVGIGGDVIGGKELAVVAGPCSVESRSQILEIAEILRGVGVKFLRGGAYKPRTSPYSFQGLREEGLRFLKEAALQTGMHIITEVKDTETLPLVADHADILQVGSRNMYNYSLLERIGDLDKPVLLKRAFSATIEELLMSAEYIASRGNNQIILCERGIRSFDSSTRNTLDLNAIPLLKRISHLPVIADPSHGTGSWDLVAPMARAAVAAGADGIMVEVHADPASALSDGFQSLRPDKFKRLLDDLSRIAPIVGRTLGSRTPSSLIANN
ncbi:MAG TPA: 3-deoxy-7-phosphoheptulonate synthase [Bacteroidota bacterium]|nr:3-deoxy-7-phosphoheptulonate synthase [Bacteroidota bacterium]